MTSLRNDLDRRTSLCKVVIAHLVLEFDLAAQHEPQVIDGLTTVVVVAIMLVYTMSIANIVFE